jgi:hypothetical protein
MADLNVGDRCPSALDSAFLSYQAFCARIGVKAASYESWLRFERLGSRATQSRSTTELSEFVNPAQHRAAQERLAAME